MQQIQEWFLFLLLADFATVMDIYFGDVENEEPVTVLPEEVATHTYAEPGDYDN